MAFTITSDPILTAGDVQRLAQVADNELAIIMANSLAAKFKRYTNRLQINENTTTDIVERVKPYGGDRLYLHAPIWTGSGFTIRARVYEGATLLYTYTYAGGDFGYHTTDVESYLMLASGWPDQTLSGFIEVTYKGGWASIPADVIQGAVLQLRVDALRMSGEVGVTSRGSQGESTAYQTAGIISEVADLWKPYRLVA